MGTTNKLPVISVKGLYKSFGEKHVLSAFDLNLYESENLVVMGKSGSGKSVMIKCIIGLEEYDRGSIVVMGKEIKSLDQDDLNDLRTDVGFLFQGSALYDSMSVRENLEFPLRRHKSRFSKNANPESLVLKTLESVGLASAIDLMPSALSGGMKRRVAIARTLILQPKIILYDEPTTGLDPITAREIIALIQSVQKEYRTSSIIITHDTDCAKALADRMILLIDGKNYIDGPYTQLAASEDPQVKAFFS
jgi:phospholipid/cholesterol/gamma-HCH transport system ATP-binding protein